MQNEEKFERYQRQMLLPELGAEGQKKLAEARILVIGAGGLGSPVLLYLAAAGVGTIGLVEFDRVDRSNLHRQVLYTNSEIGELKGERAIDRLQQMNPEIRVTLHSQYLSSKNALELIREYDMVVDGSDNLPTRYLVNDACLLSEKPFVYGAIYRFEGQVSVFNQSLPDGNRSACYRDLYPVPPDPEVVPACNTGGVLGALAGIIGSAMANEAIKLATGMGTTLHNRLWVFDALDFTSRILQIKPDFNRVPVKELIDYELYCDSKNSPTGIEEVTPTEAQALVKKNTAVLIDVREPAEFKLANAGGVNIPLGSLTAEVHRIPRRAKVILVCRSGSRSAVAIKKLQDLGFTNLVSLRGGLNRWRAEIDPDLPAC
ncbi:MAG: molybdopterin-synthase adenylyltransferase MoeB [Bacteroidota bacterium]|jgi:adenylyltransferase/sulfurtransferase